MIRSCLTRTKNFYVAHNAVVVGDVKIGKNTNIWPFVCIRADVAPISIGKNCSIQDHVMLHCRHKIPLKISDNVIIGHQACVHCNTVGSSTLIGIGARILDNCRVGSNCIIAAGSVVRPNTDIPDESLVAGVPAKLIRKITQADKDYIKDIIHRYVHLAEDHCNGKFPPVLH